jgi:hypothetical protein
MILVRYYPCKSFLLLGVDEILVLLGQFWMINDLVNGGKACTFADGLLVHFPGISKGMCTYRS